MENESPALILLCGGKSSRMGQPKGLLTVSGENWLEHQLGAFSQIGSHVIIVLGHDHEEYFKALPYLLSAKDHWIHWGAVQVKVAVNEKPELGPFSSLLCGLRELHEHSGVFVLPIDVPAPVAEVWISLRSLAISHHLEACIPEYEGHHGHPVWLSHSFLVALRKVPMDSTQARLDFQIHALPADKKGYVEAPDPRVSMNLNTPDDLKALEEGSLE